MTTLEDMAQNASKKTLILDEAADRILLPIRGGFFEIWEKLPDGSMEERAIRYAEKHNISVDRVGDRVFSYEYTQIGPFTVPGRYRLIESTKVTL